MAKPDGPRTSGGRPSGFRGSGRSHSTRRPSGTTGRAATSGRVDLAPRPREPWTARAQRGLQYHHRRRQLLAAGPLQASAVLPPVDCSSPCGTPSPHRNRSFRHSPTPTSASTPARRSTSAPRHNSRSEAVKPPATGAGDGLRQFRTFTEPERWSAPSPHSTRTRSPRQSKKQVARLTP